MKSQKAEATATEIARAVQNGATTATAAVEAALAAIKRRNPKLNVFTAVTAERARTRAAALDRDRAAGRPLGPLAGVPYAVKNLFDVKGLPTLAGSKINRDRPPAAADATLVRRLEEAGALLVGTLNMDEDAYGFTTENTHYGPPPHPRDPQRIAAGY